MLSVVYFFTPGHALLFEAPPGTTARFCAMALECGQRRCVLGDTAGMCWLLRSPDRPAGMAADGSAAPGEAKQGAPERALSGPPGDSTRSGGDGGAVETMSLGRWVEICRWEAHPQSRVLQVRADAGHTPHSKRSAALNPQALDLSSEHMSCKHVLCGPGVRTRASNSPKRRPQLTLMNDARFVTSRR